MVDALDPTLKDPDEAAAVLGLPLLAVIPFVRQDGYDPLLWVPECNCTSAELPSELKNARSHRGAAARQMAAWIRHNIHSPRLIPDP